MLDVVIRKGRHGVVGVVIVGLVADIQASETSLTSCGFEVFGEKLALFVEVVAGALGVN